MNYTTVIAIKSSRTKISDALCEEPI